MNMVDAIEGQITKEADKRGRGLCVYGNMPWNGLLIRNMLMFKGDKRNRE